MKKILDEIVWLWKAYPRAPERPGLLMRLYYFWDEAVTPAGHVLCAWILFGSLFLFVPGFTVLKGIEGASFIWILLSFIWRRKPKNRIEHVDVPMAIEGEPVQISATLDKPLSASNFLESFRMDPCIERMGGGLLKPRRRGAFLLSKIAIVETHPLGFLQKLRPYEGKAELLVAPKIKTLSRFRFMTEGASGAKFERLLRPENSRGMEFIGTREYREGDSLRDLHYKAFARYGKPFTKEYATESGGGVTLLLDVSTQNFREKMCVESAIRLFGSIAFYLLERNLLGRVFIGNEEILFQDGKSAQKKILAALARIPYADLHTTCTLKKWNVLPSAEVPVLCVAVHRVLWPAVDKQVVVVNREPKVARDDSVRYVLRESEALD